MEDRLSEGHGRHTAKWSRPIAGPEDFAEAFKVPRETIHRLMRYAELLAEGQSRANLVSAKTVPHLWDRHFADSAQILRLAPDATVRDGQVLNVPEKGVVYIADGQTLWSIARRHG